MKGDREGPHAWGPSRFLYFNVSYLTAFLLSFGFLNFTGPRKLTLPSLEHASCIVCTLLYMP